LFVAFLLSSQMLISRLGLEEDGERQTEDDRGRHLESGHSIADQECTGHGTCGEGAYGGAHPESTQMQVAR
jgi:hypothetical protein